METARTLINDALQELIVQASEQPIEAVDFQTGVRYLNRMMASFDAQGIGLGYTVVEEPTDLITVNAGAIEGMIFNLASRLATSYDIPISANLALNSRDGLQAMRAIAVVVTPSSFPCTLPTGSGNDDGNAYDNTFYACSDDELLTESGGAILLEDATPDA